MTQIHAGHVAPQEMDKDDTAAGGSQYGPANPPRFFRTDAGNHLVSTDQRPQQ